MFQRLLNQVWKLQVALKDSDARSKQYKALIADTERLLEEAEQVVTPEVAA